MRMHRVVEGAAIDDVKIGEPVVVVVEPDAAGPGSLEQRAQLCRAETVHIVDAGLIRRVFKADSRRWAGGRGYGRGDCGDVWRRCRDGRLCSQRRWCFDEANDHAKKKKA